MKGLRRLSERVVGDSREESASDSWWSGVGACALVDTAYWLTPTSRPIMGIHLINGLAVISKTVSDVCECAEVADIMAGDLSWNANLPPAT